MGIFFILYKLRIMKKIAVHLAEGFEEIEAIAIIDVLRRAGLEVVVVSITKKHEVTGSHQIQVIADLLFEEVDYNSIEMLVLPGGMPGSLNLKNHTGLIDLIQKFESDQKWLGAICAAPLVFGSLGILENRKATCYPGVENQLKGAITTGQNIEIDGNIITGKGAGVAIEFALKIVELLINRETANLLALKMIVS